ncbi:MAG: FtsX-like permease family protein, partial [Nocardioidaceae bacterium]
FWFDQARMVSVPERRGLLSFTPYQPAPVIVDPSTFALLEPGLWRVRVDSIFAARPTPTPADLESSVRSAAALDGRPQTLRDGRLGGEDGNTLAAIAAEVRDQQETARLTMAPAVVSLVLVALILLLRLLMAASELRRPELALASLRGLSSRRMWALGMSEPVAILLLAAPLGAGLGIGMTALLSRLWLVPGLPLPYSSTSLLAAAVVVVASVGIAALAVGQVLRESLPSQLAGVRRPGVAGRSLLVIELTAVAASLVIVASQLSSGRKERPDATDLVLPILLAVTAGLLATRLTSTLARRWTRGRPRGSVAGFVAVRAVARRREGTLVILPVTAAIAVAVFAGGVHQSASIWRSSAAATAAPAAQVWSSNLPLSAVVKLTQELDPDGEWVMAASTLLDPGANLVVVDSSRLATVGLWPSVWTPGHGADEVARLIAPGSDDVVFTGRRLGLEITSNVRADDAVSVQLRIQQLNGGENTAFLGPYPPGRTTRATAVPYCRAGCRITGLDIGGPAAVPTEMQGVLRLGRLTADRVPVSGGVAAAVWRDAAGPDEDSALVGVEGSGEELRVRLDSGGRAGVARLASGDVPPHRPVVVGLRAGDDIQRSGSTELIALTSAGDLPVRSVLRAESLPFLGPSGIMIDYTMMTRDHSIRDSLSTVYVLARDDAPREVVEGLEHAGLFVSTDFSDVRDRLDQDAYALALNLYAVVAVLVLVMALAGLAVSTLVQLPARRQDAAALRVVGVARRAVMSSIGRELVVVLGGATVAGLAAGLLAQFVVLRTITLGYAQDGATPRVVTTMDGQRLAAVAAVAAMVLAVAAITSASLTVRGARGSTLRESTR